MDAPAVRFLANHVPLFHDETRVERERERAIAEDRIVLGEAKNRRLQVRDECNNLNFLRLPV